ncbi:MSMEG_0565 family glycosyltransferase [Pseudanabaena sp. FACHB-1998]|uniref:MSMEG_0565 family glycosyltransferase n=1 Tax=Pseudanabaena sp. FACHB-1998 TaxID=2692858 RepID=UPI001680B42F|nr:MSMEG_0565 family glycosyltransferase [Pseudanabaena sp. FACHB-1998]MBD2176926.1 MSMEG_0565 family glycosyltransferase [Pseudanabaena sp. FACHB-1998]
MLPKSNLRIALLTYSTKPRGSVIHTLELAEALQKLGHEVCIFALDKDGLGFERHLVCQFQAVLAKSAPKEIDLLIQQRIQEFVDYLVDYLSAATRDFDIYHAQDCISANALAILRSQGLIPHFVRTVHHIEDYNSPYLQACQDRSIREAELCLCVSDSWQQQLYEHYQIHASRVINGVNLERFSGDRNGMEAQIQQKFGLGLIGSPVYLTVGGIEPRKNSIRLIQAFAQVLNDFPNAQLVIAGGSTLFDYQDYREQFFGVVDKLGIAQSLVITGVLTDAELATLYRCADAFVFPSAKEGWGLVIMEAIASGLPVITSDCLPFTEFLSHQSALLVNPDDVEAIARAMQRVTQPNIRDSLVKMSQPVLSQYTWQNSAQMHRVHYQKMAKLN